MIYASTANVYFRQLIAMMVMTVPKIVVPTASADIDRAIVMIMIAVPVTVA